MRGLFYGDGHFPLTISDKAYRAATGLFEPVTVWDGSTVFGSTPSKYATDLFPVVGYGTDNPFALTIEQALRIYWKPKIARATLTGLSAFSATADTDTDTFPADSIYIECDGSVDPGDGSYVPVRTQLDLAGYCSPRFKIGFDDVIPPSAQASFASGGVSGSATLKEMQFFADPTIYKVGDAYYPRIDLFFSMGMTGTSGPGSCSFLLERLYTLAPSAGATVVPVPCTWFGQDLGLSIRCEQKIVTTGTGASTTGDSSDLALDIGVPPTGGYLDYGGLYDPDTGERV